MQKSRQQTQGPAPSAPDYGFDLKIQEGKSTTDDVREIISDLITSGAHILYVRYIESQKLPYACRTLARELVLNASWASIPIDSAEIFAEPDDDLVIPPIDEWAGGVLPVRNSDASSLRCSVTPQRDLRKTATLHRPLAIAAEPPPNARIPGAVSRSSLLLRSAAPARSAQRRARAAAPVLTDAQVITRAFEEARKRTNIAMKAVTVDADFTVIQIAEPKGLPPALIVPKVTTRAKAPARPTQVIAVARVVRPAAKTEPKRRRRPQSTLIQPDVPVFDEEVASISYSDRFVCAPGVTFRDGTAVKTRPQVVNNTQMTRVQYDAYLEEMRRSGE
jgi:hypothetical protein